MPYVVWATRLGPSWFIGLDRWVEVDSFDLLPGDIVSLTRHKPHFDKGDGSESAIKEKTAAAASGKGKVEDEGGDVVPADILLLRGTCVVNEASLTGESVPQMKEGLSDIVDGDDLSMKTKHKTQVLYAGTKLLQCKGIDIVEAEEESSDEDENGGVSANGGEAEKLYGSIPKPPDGGCLCFVLRTGFSSAQGKLVRMIEGSQEKVKGHERETGLASAPAAFSLLWLPRPTCCTMVCTTRIGRNMSFCFTVFSLLRASSLRNFQCKWHWQ